jgi:hypothetical protein
MKVTIRDLRRLKICSNGARKFAERHSLDWSEFVKNGIDEQTLEQTNDAMAIKIIEEIRRGK